MGIITNIKEGIETRLGVVAPTYNRLSYQVDIDKNKFKGNNKGYSVLPAPASEVDSVLGAFTLDHSFKVTLVNSYSNGAKSQVGDTLQADRITEIMDDIVSIYKDLVNNKKNIETSILIINGLSIEDPEFIEEEKVIKVVFNINIKHKTNL